MNHISLVKKQQHLTLDDLFRQAPIAICIFRGPEYVLETINERMLDIWGTTLDRVINRPLFESMPEAIDQGLEKILADVYKTGESFTTEEFSVTLTRFGKKENFFVKFICKPLREENGEISGIFMTADEVTEQVNARRKIRENETLFGSSNRKSIEEDMARFEAIIQSSVDAIVGKTLEGIVTSWNKSAQRIFGYTADEMIGRPIQTLIPVDRLAEESYILDRIRSGERVETFETKRITKEGKIIDVSLSISPIKNSIGGIIGASKIVRDITLQKRLNEALRESEERLKMAVASTQLGTWEYYPLTGVLVWSKECCDIYDVPPQMEIDFNFFTDHIHAEDREYVSQTIQKSLDPKGDGTYTVQCRITRYRDKQIRWINAQGKVFFNHLDQPERFIGTVLDITKEKNKEQGLIESIELFQTMADNVPAMIWMSGSDKFNDYFNRTWLKFTGRTIEEEGKDGWLKGVHPDDVQKCVNLYHDSSAKQTGFYTEYRLRRYDGQYRWIADNSIPRLSPEGEFLGFISACIDIDDQKRFSEKMLDSELLFKTISNASPTALWMTDRKKKYVFISDTWLKWTGKSFDDQMSRGWFSALLEEDRQPVITRFLECFDEEKYFTAEFRVPDPFGQIRWCMSEGKPYYDINGNFAGYTGSVTDISEIKMMEQRKDDFIKMASHELKTPITSINGYVQLLLNIYDQQDDEKLEASRSTVKSSLTTVSKQVTKLTRLVSELLDLSKIESGKLELNRTEFKLEDLVEEAIQDARHTTSRHALIFQSEFKGNIIADRDRINQVLANLLNNAIKYSKEADKIEVILDGDDVKATIFIKDYGIGIDKKDQQKIFERFYRVEGKSEQTYPGFGIGLFIASEIVQRHEGTIAVNSRRNRGSLFTVTLPLGPKNKFFTNGSKNPRS